VREIRTPGSERGASGNWRSYRDKENKYIVKVQMESLIVIEVNNENITISNNENEISIGQEDIAKLRKMGRQIRENTLSYKEKCDIGCAIWEITLGCLSGLENTQMRIEIRESQGLSEEMLAIPWENIIEPKSQTLISCHSFFSLFRTTNKITEYRSENCPESELLPIRVLIFYSSPINDATKSQLIENRLKDSEQQALLNCEMDLQSALYHLEDSGLVSYQIHGRDVTPTLLELANALEKRPQILHLLAADVNSNSQLCFLIKKQDNSIGTLLLGEILNLFNYLPYVPRIIIISNINEYIHNKNVAITDFFLRSVYFGVNTIINLRNQDNKGVSCRFWEQFYGELANGNAISDVIKQAVCRLNKEKSVGFYPVCYLIHPEYKLITNDLRDKFEITEKQKTRPFKGIISYGISDFNKFFGRDSEIKKILSMILSPQNKHVIMYGDSGVGKTSIIQAGVIPRLREAGLQPLYITHYQMIYHDIIESINAKTKTEKQIFHFYDAEEDIDKAIKAIDEIFEASNFIIPIILDHAENLLLHPLKNELLKLLFERSKHSPRVCKIIFVVSSDFLYLLKNYIKIVHSDDTIEEYHLRPFTSEIAKEVLNRIKTAFQFQFEDGLEKRLLADLKYSNEADYSDSHFLDMPQFSFILRYLYSRRKPSSYVHSTLLNEEYERLNINTLFRDRINKTIKQIDESGTSLASDILIQLIDMGTMLPISISVEALSAEMGVEKHIITDLLYQLSKEEIVREVTPGCFELTHKILIPIIKENCISEEIILREKAHFYLKVHMDIWLKTGQALPEDHFIFIYNTFQHLSLTISELALYISSLIFHNDYNNNKQNKIQYIFPRISYEQRKSLIEFFRSSDSQIVRKFSILYTNRISLLEMYEPMIQLETISGLEEQTRYLEESVLPDIEKQLMGIRTKKEQKDADIERNRKIAMEFVENPKSSKSDVNYYINILEVLGILREWLIFSPPNISKYWSGLWISYIPVSFIAILLTIILSWIGWMDQTQSVLDILCIFSFVLLSMLSCATAMNIYSLTQVVRFYQTKGFHGIMSKIKLHFHLTKANLTDLFCYFLLAYFALHFLIILSNWIHYNIFSFAFFSKIQWLFSHITDSSLYINTFNEAIKAAITFLTNLPLLGIVISSMLEKISTGSILIQIIFVTLFLLFAILTIFEIFFIILFHFLFPLVILIPPILIFLVSCLNYHRIFFPINNIILKRQVGEFIALLFISSIGLPLSLNLGHQLIEILNPYLCWKDFFYPQLGHISVQIRQLSMSWISYAIGLIFPLLYVLLLNLLGNRSIRFHFGKINGFGFINFDNTAIRSLISEGSYEAFHYLLYMIKKYPTVRNLENFNLIYSIAIEDAEKITSHLKHEEKEMIANEAELTLYDFSFGYWKNKELIRLLKNDINKCCNDSKRKRLNRILIHARQMKAESLAANFSDLLTEQLKNANIQNKPTNIVEFAKRKFGKKGKVAAYVGIIAACIQFYLYFGTHIIDYIFPLSQAIGIYPFDISWLIRIIELAIIGIFIYCGYYLFISYKSRNQ
jgi:hypothetical protein